MGFLLTIKPEATKALLQKGPGKGTCHGEGQLWRQPLDAPPNFISPESLPLIPAAPIHPPANMGQWSLLSFPKSAAIKTKIILNSHMEQK